MVCADAPRFPQINDRLQDGSIAYNYHAAATQHLQLLHNIDESVSGCAVGHHLGCQRSVAHQCYDTVGSGATGSNHGSFLPDTVRKLVVGTVLASAVLRRGCIFRSSVQKRQP
jgi:hypothetical protein